MSKAKNEIVERLICSFTIELEQAIATARTEALREAESKYKADAERLAEAITGILDDADEFAVQYASRWREYRLDVQETKRAKVEQARIALKLHEGII